MPNKTILPPPYLTLEDSNGATIVNGSVKFLETGTAILAVVYADADGLVVSANPLTVDGAGRYTVFVTPGQVLDLEFYDSHGALVHTVDQVQAIPSVSGNVDVQGTFGQAVTAGDPVYLSLGYGGGIAGQWYRSNATVSMGADVQPTLGIALTTVVQGGSGAIRLSGRVTDLAGLVVGQVYYVANSGALALTPGSYARAVGQADTTTSLVLWPNPPGWPTVTNYPSAGAVTQFDPHGATTVYLTNASLLTIHGIKVGYEGQRLRFAAFGARVDFPWQSASALAADRLYNWVQSGPTSLVSPAPGSAGIAEYEVIGGSWHLVAHEQGGWIPVPFDATNYSATSGTWTVAVAHVYRHAYQVRGKSCAVQVWIDGGVIGGTPSNLNIHHPGAFQATAGIGGPCTLAQSIGPLASGAFTVGATTAIVTTDLFGSSPFVAGTSWVRFQYEFEVI